MNEFNELRKRALERRERTIATARAEYEANLLAIAKLEQALLGRLPSHHKPAAKCISQVIPKDRTFTPVDILASLEALDPGRVWSPRCINEAISRMRKRGILKRVKRSSGDEPAVYAVADLDVPKTPFQDQRLVDAVAAMVQEKPLRQTEICMTLLERGYQTKIPVRTFRVLIGRVLREGAFSQDRGNRWRVEGGK